MKKMFLAIAIALIAGELSGGLPVVADEPPTSGADPREVSAPTPDLCTAEASLPPVLAKPDQRFELESDTEESRLAPVGLEASLCQEGRGCSTSTQCDGGQCFRHKCFC